MMDIDKAFEQFIEFQEGSSGNLVTTVSAKLFAKYCTETLQEENERLLAANRHSEDMYRQIDDERKRLQAEVELMRSYRDAERQWEMLMMRLVGEDGLGSVEQAVTELKQERDQLKAVMAQCHEAMCAVSQAAYYNAVTVCCCRNVAGIECCGSPEPDWSEYDEFIMDTLSGPINAAANQLFAKAAASGGSDE
jgi:hypothetical protein